MIRRTLRLKNLVRRSFCFVQDDESSNNLGENISELSKTRCVEKVMEQDRQELIYELGNYAKKTKGYATPEGTF